MNFANCKMSSEFIHQQTLDPLPQTTVVPVVPFEKVYVLCSVSAYSLFIAYVNGCQKIQQKPVANCSNLRMRAIAPHGMYESILF